MTPRDTQELLEAVRAGIDTEPVWNQQKQDRANAADAALTELAQYAEDGWKAAAGLSADLSRFGRENEELVERLEVAERERDEYRNARRMMAADREALERDLSSSQAAALLLHKRVEELTAERDESDAELLDVHNRAEAAEAQLAERDKRIQEAQVLLMEGAGLVFARDKRIEGLREALKAADRLLDDVYAKGEKHADDLLRVRTLVSAALADPVVVAE